jgi:hypothetical protein
MVYRVMYKMVACSQLPSYRVEEYKGSNSEEADLYDIHVGLIRGPV